MRMRYCFEPFTRHLANRIPGTENISESSHSVIRVDCRWSEPATVRWKHLFPLRGDASYVSDSIPAACGPAYFRQSTMEVA